MALRDWLTLTGSVVTVTRITRSTDNMGGYTSTSATTGIPRCAIWSPSQSRSLVSDKMTLNSTHVLVTIPGDYTFTTDDDYVSYNGKTYKINGPTDDVMFLGEIAVTGLELRQ